MFGVFEFGESYFAEALDIVLPVTPPTGTGGANLFVDRFSERLSTVAVSADLVIPVPDFTAWITVVPSTVTLEAFLHVPVPVLTMDWITFPETPISGYARKGHQPEEEEAWALQEHYMQTVTAWAKKRK